MKNELARLAFAWVYSDVPNDLPKKLNYDGWFALYERTQENDFETMQTEEFKFVDDCGESTVLFNTEDFNLSEQDALNLMFSYAEEVFSVIKAGQ